MFTLEQKVDFILRYIATNDNAKRSQMKKSAIEMLNSGEPITPVTPTVDDMIINLLRRLGMPQHLDGYKYVINAIKLCVLDPSYIKGVTKRLYPDIASLYSTTPSKVERCMRHAIVRVLDGGDWNDIEHVFGNTISVHNGNITLREFIIACANEITRKMKKMVIEVK
jgi:two-component system response regulator (stage 0 sporulation protein A)